MEKGGKHKSLPLHLPASPLPCGSATSNCELCRPPKEEKKRYSVRLCCCLELLVRTPACLPLHPTEVAPPALLRDITLRMHFERLGDKYSFFQLLKNKMTHSGWTGENASQNVQQLPQVTDAWGGGLI